MRPHPWDSPGKNTGVGCHFLLQCMKVKSQSEVAQSCLTLSDVMDCSLPGSSIYGIFQARVLEWGAIAFSTHQSTRGHLWPESDLSDFGSSCILVLESKEELGWSSFLSVVSTCCIPSFSLSPYLHSLSPLLTGFLHFSGSLGRKHGHWQLLSFCMLQKSKEKLTVSPKLKCLGWLG